MQRFSWPAVGLGLLIGLTAPAHAFDPFMMAGQQAVNMSFSVRQNIIADTARNAAIPPRSRTMTTRQQAGATHSLSGPGVLGFAPGEAAVVRPLGYQPSSALERETITAFLGRLEQKDPAAARAVGPLLDRHGYNGEFRRFIRGTPLTDTDAADAVAMYLVMAYLIANDDMRDMPASHWIAVRNQFRAALGAQPQLADTAARAALGEEMKLLTAILYGGYDGNKKAGRSQQYADGVAAMFRKKGLDFRAMTLDERGLLVRG